MTHDHQAGSDRPARNGSHVNPRRHVAGNTVFLPAATAYAIFILPASVFAMLWFAGAFPALASATGHAHEMLFGLALATVAGDQQLGPMPRPRLALLGGLWVIARAMFLSAPRSMTAHPVGAHSRPSRLSHACFPEGAAK